MTKKVKRVISAIVSFALMLTVLATPLGDVVGVTKDSVGTTASAATVYFSNYSSSISSGDSKINEALGLVNNQGGNTSISGKSKTDLVKYFLYESKYSVYNGQGLPYEYSNQYYNDTGKYCGTFSDVNGSVGYSRYVGASGCRAYAWFVRAVFYNTKGSEVTICEKGKATSAAIKSYVIKNSQAGESLSYGSAHANIFVAASDSGIFVLNYGGATNEKPTFRYITYDNMAKYANARGVGIYTRNPNTAINQSHTHSYTSSITKSATCTSTGVRTYKCSCGASYTESISALGHSYGSWTTATSATCTSGGTEKRTCSRCGNSETRSTSALGHSYGSTYYEAAHPHYYAHMCSRCGYKEYTGGNLSYYEKCDTCRNNNAPNKAEFINLNSSYKEGSDIVFDWTTTDKTTHYHLLFYKQNEEGEYDIIHRIDYATQGSTVNNFSAGNYRVLIQSYNSNYYFINSSGWGDWIHTESDYAYFSVQHNYVAYVINPTLAAEGYTLHECSVCGDSYKDNYTAKLLPAEKVTGLAYESRISDSITLKWNKSENADGYIVEYLSGDRFVKLADKTSGSAVSHIATGLEPGTLYKFRIRAYRNVNGSRAYASYSDVLCVRTLPAAMSGFALGARTDTTITLKWNKNESANGYVIEKYNGTKWVTLATKTSNTAVSHKVTGLQASTVYKFRVRSYIKDEEGRIYGEYTSTLSACTNPSVVEGLTLGGRASNALRLNWTENTSADGYIIEKYNGTSWSRIAKITSNATTTYRVTGLSAGTTYKFRIKAYKMSGSTALYSGYTATLSARTNPSNVIGVEIGGVASTALRVNWTKNTSADGYIVEIYKGGAWVRVAKITNNTTVTYRISGLAKNTTYKIRIKAYKMSGTTALYSGYTTISGKTNT